MSFVTIGSAEAEIVEKKSRFIATAKEIHSEQEALEFLETIRKKYWDARHNCFAYVVGKNSDLQRFSDDKEPQGTAGKPILEVINGAGLHNTIIVVTRYFGGVLLGTGGLVKAYSQAAASVIKAMKDGCSSGRILEVNDGLKIKFACGYKDAGRIDSLISLKDISILEKEYGEKAVYTIALDKENAGSFEKAAADATKGAYKAENVEDITFCSENGTAFIYNFN